MNSDLSNVQVGDKLIVCVANNKRLVCVTRITKTQIVVDNIKYNRKTGRRLGVSNWHYEYLRIPTESDITEIRLRTLKCTLWKRLEELKHQIANMDEDTVTKLLEKLNLSKE